MLIFSFGLLLAGAWAASSHSVLLREAAAVRPKAACCRKCRRLSDITVSEEGGNHRGRERQRNDDAKAAKRENQTLTGRRPAASRGSRIARHLKLDAGRLAGPAFDVLKPRLDGPIAFRPGLQSDPDTMFSGSKERRQLAFGIRARPFDVSD